MMKINPKQLEKAMKQMGIKQEEIQAEEVIIKTADKEIVISSPNITKVNMMGQDSYQISGQISERPLQKFGRDDIKMIMEQTGCTEKEAENVLEETGDLASAILKLK